MPGILLVAGGEDGGEGLLADDGWEGRGERDGAVEGEEGCDGEICGVALLAKSFSNHPNKHFAMPDSLFCTSCSSVRCNLGTLGNPANWSTPSFPLPPALCTAPPPTAAPARLYPVRFLSAGSFLSLPPSSGTGASSFSCAFAVTAGFPLAALSGGVLALLLECRRWWDGRPVARHRVACCDAAVLVLGVCDRAVVAARGAARESLVVNIACTMRVCDAMEMVRVG